MRRRLWLGCAAAILAAVALAGCGGGTERTSAATASSAPASTTAAKPLAWSGIAHVNRILDVAGPRPDGAMVLAANGHLLLLRHGHTVVPYPGHYHSPGGEEPYIAVAPAPAPHTCGFHAGTVYAIRLRPPRGVVAISPSGRTRQFARVSTAGQISGIAFDRTGAFHHRLLITVRRGPRSTVLAISCRGAVTAVTRRAPRVEGGIAVAPATFGRFGGDLIAPDENTGRIFAIGPSGRTRLVARSDLPHGGDIGVESLGFVVAEADALTADRLTPGNRHPGDDLLLRLSAFALARATTRPGDLLAVTEGGARTDAVRCRRHGCTVRHIADGPAVAHGEGHVAFLPAGG